MKTLALINLAALTILATSSAYADDQWSIRRATTSGACHIGKEPQDGKLGDKLTSLKDVKSACDEANTRRAKSDEAADTKKCQGYTQGAVRLCKDAGVKL
jgi:hypothetical protein